MGKFLSESWLVLLLSVVFSLLLAGAQATFGPKIAENRNAELERAAKAVLPEGVESAEKIEVTVDGQQKVIFKCQDADGKLIGWALVNSDFGFQDKIKLVVGLSPDGTKITGLQVVENTETPGLGNKIQEDKWAVQYKGLDATKPVAVSKAPPSKDNNEIQAITGATISSEAVTRIANDAISKLRPKLDELK